MQHHQYHREARVTVLDFASQKKFLINNCQYKVAGKIHKGLAINIASNLIDTTTLIPYQSQLSKFNSKHACAHYQFDAQPNIEAEIVNLMLQNFRDLGEINEYTFLADYSRAAPLEKLVEHKRFSNITNIRHFALTADIKQKAHQDAYVHHYYYLIIDFGLVEVERFAESPNQGSFLDAELGSLSHYDQEIKS